MFGVLQEISILLCLLLTTAGDGTTLFRLCVTCGYRLEQGDISEEDVCRT